MKRILLITIFFIPLLMFSEELDVRFNFYTFGELHNAILTPDEDRIIGIADSIYVLDLQGNPLLKRETTFGGGGYFPNSNNLILSEGNRPIVYDLENDLVIQEFEPAPVDGDLENIIISENGRYIVSRNVDNYRDIFVWDTETGNRMPYNISFEDSVTFEDERLKRYVRDLNFLDNNGNYVSISIQDRRNNWGKFEPQKYRVFKLIYDLTSGEIVDTLIFNNHDLNLDLTSHTVKHYKDNIFTSIIEDFKLRFYEINETGFTQTDSLQLPAFESNERIDDYDFNSTGEYGYFTSRGRRSIFFNITNESLLINYDGGGTEITLLENLEGVLFNTSSGRIGIINLLPTNVEEQTSQINISPNPVREQLNLSVSENTTVNKIMIQTVEGKVVYEDTNSVMTNHLSINVADLARGKYYISIQTNTDTITKEFLKE